MKTKFVNFFTEDHLKLEGLYFAPDDSTSTTALIHVHGLAGNFYENAFIEKLATTLATEGISLLTFNNRGHDYIADIQKKSSEGWSTVPGGGAYEIFRESLMDIDAAINFVKVQGVENIILQGHSSGANKIVFYQAQRENNGVIGLILLSPCDDIGIQKATIGDEKFADLLNIADEMHKAGNEGKLMPEGSFFSYPLSAKTYRDYFKFDSDRDTFPYRDMSCEFTNLSKISEPILVMFGNNGEYILEENPSETVEKFKSKAQSASKVRAEVLDGATHNYQGHEAELTSIVTNWIKEIR